MSISNNTSGYRPGICTSTTRPTAPYIGQHIYETDSGKTFLWDGSHWGTELQNISVALSDEYTPLYYGTNKFTMRVPYAMKLVGLPRASLNTASPYGSTIIDINVNGSSILSTKLSIDTAEKTSVTAATPAVWSSTIIADDAELSFDIDQSGSDAVGLKVTLYYRIL